MARRKRTRGILLPWERRGAWLREMFAGRRWKLALAALAVLMMIVVVWRAAERQSKVRSTRISIEELRSAVTAFRTDFGRCPRSAVELLHPPHTARRYLRSMPKDGWGRKLWIRCPSRFDEGDVDVVSSGPRSDFFDDDNVQ